jgi:DNA-binding LytR/AlgR family response regulator
MVFSVILVDNDSATIDSLVLCLRGINPRLIATVTTIPNEVAKILGENTAHIVFVNRDSVPSDVAASILQLPFQNVPVVVMGIEEEHSSNEQESQQLFPLEEYRYRYSAVADYLPLPCTPERVRLLIEHLRNLLAQRELERWKDEQLIMAIQQNAFLMQRMQHLSGAEESTHTEAGSWYLASDELSFEDEELNILYCAAEGNYSILHRLLNGAIQKDFLAKSIGTLEQEWSERYASDEHPFLVRIHNSTIVNINYVESVQRHENRKDYIVRLQTGEEFPLSRTYKHVVERLPKVDKKSRKRNNRTTRPTD